MWWTVAKEATTSWSRHKDARQGAALAYYSVFSLGPIIVIAIVIAGLFFGNDAVTSQVTSALKDMLGETGAKAVESMLAGASRPAEGALATILGIGALLFAAIGVVVQLKDALNMVGGGGIGRERALAFRPQLRVVVRCRPGAGFSSPCLSPGDGRSGRGRQICGSVHARGRSPHRQLASLLRGRGGALRDDVQVAAGHLRWLARRVARSGCCRVL
jgi:hypothetical protein